MRWETSPELFRAVSGSGSAGDGAATAATYRMGTAHWCRPRTASCRLHRSRAGAGRRAYRRGSVAVPVSPADRLALSRLWHDALGGFLRPRQLANCLELPPFRSGRVCRVGRGECAEDNPVPGSSRTAPGNRNGGMVRGCDPAGNLDFAACRTVADPILKATFGAEKCRVNL